MPRNAGTSVVSLFFCACALPLLVSGCRTAAETVVWSDEEKEIHRLEVELQLTRDELQVRDEQSSELKEQVAALQETIPGLEEELRELRLQIAAAGDEGAAEIE